MVNEPSEVVLGKWAVSWRTKYEPVQPRLGFEPLWPLRQPVQSVQHEQPLFVLWRVPHSTHLRLPVPKIPMKRGLEVQMKTCKHKVKCPYCSENSPGILSGSRDGVACHCAKYGKTGEAFCGEPVLVGNLCYDHAKMCSTCHDPYDPNESHVCTANKEQQ